MNNGVAQLAHIPVILGVTEATLNLIDERAMRQFIAPQMITSVVDSAEEAHEILGMMHPYVERMRAARAGFDFIKRPVPCFEVPQEAAKQI